MATRDESMIPSGPTMQPFAEIQLTFQQARVLGCFLKKEILTPGHPANAKFLAITSH